jgi:hypothetical protein
MREIMKNTQNIKLESFKDKSTLVKLLAEEDLQVTYKKVPTAHFDVNAREIVLPIWKDKSESVMDMMSLHEVGHALWTPLDLIEKGQKQKVKHSFLNVLEDVRIEKMIQEKYLGSKKIFKKAYDELLEKDFFGINEKDLSKLNLIDKINMHYKHVPNIPFEDNELEWVEKANQTKTADDVLNLAVELQEWMYSQEKDKTDEMFDIDLPFNESENDDIENQDEKNSSNMESDDTEETEDESEDDDSTSGSGSDRNDNQKENESSLNKLKDGGEDFDGIESVTDSNYTKNQHQAASDEDIKETEILNIPKININEAIVDYKEINKDLTDFYKEKSQGSESNKKYMEWVVKTLKKFENEQKPVISYMVKEFEMRKAADLYKRASISKTGSLNMDKLHSYSYNEDIFLKMTNLPGATNHGLVMFVDWSGSMADNFHNTLKQTMNLIWFCKRVNIPFEVYAFSNQYGKKSETTNRNLLAQTPKQNDMVVNDCTLLNMVSSRANKNEFNESMINLWAISNYYSERGNYGGIRHDEDYIYPIYIPTDFMLGGTPLNNAIVYAMDILPKYKKDNGIQKLHTVFLTDGASHNITGKYEWGTAWSSEGDVEEFRQVGISRNYENDVIIVDPINRKKVKCPAKKDSEYSKAYYYSTYHNQTEILLSFLKARVQGMNIVNFFIAGRNRKGTVSKNDIEHIFGLNSWDDERQIKSIQKEILKNNVAVCTSQGWDEMYVLPGGQKLDVSNDDMSEVQPGAKKSELKKAFSKMSSGRKNSRPVLNKFIGMIA